MLNGRSSAVITPTLINKGATQALVLAGVGTYNSDPLDVGAYSELLATLNVSAQSGTTPTLDIKFQTSCDKINWVDLGDAFAQVTTTTGVTLKKLTSNFGKYIRAVVTEGGTTPSYTFDLLLAAKG